MTKYLTLYSLLAVFYIGRVCGFPIGTPIERNLNEKKEYHPKQEYHTYHPKLEAKERRSQVPTRFHSTVAPGPTASPSESPAPSPSPSAAPTEIPTSTPSSSPTKTPTASSDSPTESPAPSPSPSDIPTGSPSASPSSVPSVAPSSSIAPSASPSSTPTNVPSQSPSLSQAPSQAPSGSLQPYLATEVEIIFERVASYFNMDGDDVDLFQKTTKEYLENNFLSNEVDEIQFEDVTVTKQYISGGRRRLNTVRALQVYNLSLTFNVLALVKHDWSEPFDLKGSIETYFADNSHIKELRSLLEAEGGDFVIDPTPPTSEEQTTIERVPDPDDEAASIGLIIGAVVGSVFVVGIVAKLLRRRNFSSQRSKISLASTDSQDDYDDESSEAEMISSNKNPSQQQIMLLFSPREENESSLSIAARPAFLTTENNIEIPETPIGFTPQSTRTRAFAMDTPNSIFSAKNSTRSTAFRKFLMDTPPSALNGKQNASRGFFPPPRSAGGSQRNLRQGKDTIDMSPITKDLSKLEEANADSSSIQILNEVDYMKAKAAAKENEKNKKKKKKKASKGLTAPSSIDNARSMGRFRLRKGPSEYISDESSSDA